jgi:hypothetical protein
MYIAQFNLKISKVKKVTYKGQHLYHCIPVQNDPKWNQRSFPFILFGSFLVYIHIEEALETFILYPSLGFSPDGG